MNKKSVAIIGNGAREHALCWKLQTSSLISTIYMIRGNGGTISNVGNVQNVNIDFNVQTIVEWCCENKIYLVLVGPEQFLADDISYLLAKNGIKCFGPSKKAAQIEADKSWCKKFMEQFDIPTAKGRSFNDFETASFYIKQNFIENESIVIKASGLAQGKGVFICQNKNEAIAVLKNMMILRSFGDAGNVVVIEEYLEGEEVSILAFCDGRDYDLMLPVQDHKRLKDNDEGPNTGGMGAVCPYYMTENDLKFIKNNIFEKTIMGLYSINCPFKGVLYAGLMLTNNGIKVLEFNCRFGDPETQILLPLLESDLFPILEACCDGTLKECKMKWSEKFSVGIVMASSGYPTISSPETVIIGLPLSQNEKDVQIFHAATEFRKELYFAKSGRILTVVAVNYSLILASAVAKRICSGIMFHGRQYRKDIANRAIARYILKCGLRTYQSAGVNISFGNELVQDLKTLVTSTYDSNVFTPLGSFAAAYDLKIQEYEYPLLVTGCDGVGTKLKVAETCNNYKTVGQDLVAMSVNDILALGAKPLFFLDYIACGVLNKQISLELIQGIIDGCKKASCALIGGETAEMPGILKQSEYEIAGFAVGIVEKNLMLPTKNIIPGDKVIYLPSSGVHSNGFSLIRKIMEDRDLSYFDKAAFSTRDLTYGEEFLQPTTIYSEVILELHKNSSIKSFAHITGGGLTENIIRVLPDNLLVELDATKWNILPVFGWISVMGEVPEQEMLRTFNCGVGGVVIVDVKSADNVATYLNSRVVGEIRKRNADESQIKILNFDNELKNAMLPFISLLSEPQTSFPKRVAVFISGVGTNLKALLEATLNSCSIVQIVLVISNKSTAEGINIARQYNVRSEVIEIHKGEKREEHENRIQAVLNETNIDIICLAGYMRVLTESFVKKWRGKMLNIHPSLLPSFPGLKPQLQAINYGVKYSGCTVHFVELQIDSGAIIEQGVVEVKSDDDEESLIERIKEVEHKIYPKALKLIASGKIILDLDTGKVKRL